MGHKKIAVIGGDKETSDTGRLRYEGCMDSFKEHGIDFDPELDYQGVRFSCKDGYNAANALLKNNRGFTAIFAAAVSAFTL